MFLERIPVRFRLSLGHAVWMVLLFAGIGCGVYKLVERHLLLSVDAALITSAKSIRNARAAIQYRSPFTQSFLREFFGEKFIRPYAQLVDLSGRVSARTENIRVSLPVTPLAVARAEHGLETLENISGPGKFPLRLITLPIMRQGRFAGELIQVGAPLEATYHTLSSISLMLWIAMPVGLMMSIIFGYILTAWSLRPVQAVTRTVSRLSSDDLNVRLKLPRAKDEISELSQTFNSMLDRLQDAFTRVRRFASDVSHELRTPLTVLRGEAELALRRERSKEEYQESLRIIAKESQSMTMIMEDLLLLAKVQNKTVAMTWEKIPLENFIAMIIDSIQPLADKKNICIETIRPENCEEFYASSGYFPIILKNILLNAIKHSPNNSKVLLKIIPNEKTFTFAVQDFGEGMTRETIPYIFDPFFRADTARNRDNGGSGIGLSIALALVDLHEGKLEVDSELNKGSEFRIILPKEPPSSNTFPPKNLSKNKFLTSGGPEKAEISRNPRAPERSVLAGT